MDYGTLRRLVRTEENGRIEYKRTIAELKGACEYLCAFLNESRPRGMVIIGARTDGALLGQDVGEDTRRRLAADMTKIEPVCSALMEIVDLPNAKKAMVLIASPAPELRPYTYDGRAFERRDNTTVRMSQQQYQRLLLNRIQAQSRWETGTLPASRL
jgi:ATP-dependent DNA helicase RecG